MRQQPVASSLLVLVAVIVLAQATYASQKQFSVPPPESWMLEQWTKDSQPYHSIKADIDGAMEKGEGFNRLTQRYKKKSENNAYAPIDQFGLAYVMYKAAIAAHSLDQNGLINARNLLTRATPPHAYDYTRLRFLIEARLFVGRQFHGFKLVGERLLHHDPNDVEVKYQLVDVLGDSPFKIDQDQAVTYAQSLVRLDAHHANYHASLAGAYMSRWLLGSDRSDADKAVAEYQQYLSLAPPTAGFRDQAERMIKTIRIHE